MDMAFHGQHAHAYTYEGAGAPGPGRGPSLPAATPAPPAPDAPSIPPMAKSPAAEAPAPGGRPQRPSSRLAMVFGGWKAAAERDLELVVAGPGLSLSSSGGIASMSVGPLELELPIHPAYGHTAAPGAGAAAAAGAGAGASLRRRASRDSSGLAASEAGSSLGRRQLAAAREALADGYRWERGAPRSSPGSSPSEGGGSSRSDREVARGRREGPSTWGRAVAVAGAPRSGLSLLSASALATDRESPAGGGSTTRRTARSTSARSWRTAGGEAGREERRAFISAALGEDPRLLDGASHPVSLSFLDPPLEAAFRAEYAAESLLRMGINGLVAICAMLVQVRICTIKRDKAKSKALFDIVFLLIAYEPSRKLYLPVLGPLAVLPPDPSLERRALAVAGLTAVVPSVPLFRRHPVATQTWFPIIFTTIFAAMHTLIYYAGRLNTYMSVPCISMIAGTVINVQDAVARGRRTLWRAGIATGLSIALACFGLEASLAGQAAPVQDRPGRAAPCLRAGSALIGAALAPPAPVAGAPYFAAPCFEVAVLVAVFTAVRATDEDAAEQHARAERLARNCLPLQARGAYWAAGLSRRFESAAVVFVILDPGPGRGGGGGDRERRPRGEGEEESARAPTGGGEGAMVPTDAGDHEAPPVDLGRLGSAVARLEALAARHGVEWIKTIGGARASTSICK
eukprot:tig00021339_g20379.t1